ncbi:MULTISPECIES: S1C family serine protease [Marinomonas]|uniref:Trypsin-like peptidase domain-containing protein n=1 Tax=Marinomonas arctica TaxID=383750 RepID=A0A7H1JB06_9GAMM|nr:MULTISPECIES: trypsin-like peptidase domain-containing protein [Marinomonas]MCS7486820.1 alginate regulatory protein [Marinomonas sp. BSi20414]QNT07672.1 trypsin-like peptidase domain-containing protein [Marinomonas arctica]GGN21733.1 2-alkenal reductase [Marinomonas arctica]
MNQKNAWSPLILSALAGACIGLTVLLIQEKHKTTSDSYSTSVQIATPSVVNIYTQVIQQKGLNDLDTAKHSINLGSGVIVTKDGFILTNHHVIQNAQSIVIALHDDRRIKAQLIGSDPSTDLAVLKIPHLNLPSIKMGDSSKVSVGDRILAIGNPFGIGQTVTAGIISAKGRNSIGLNTYENFLQTDAAINPGNSGGALVNLKGELIGISSAIYSSSGGSQGIGFATPVDDAMEVMTDIIQYGEVIRGYLGMEAQKITPLLADNLSLPSNHGLLVNDITKESPAEKAGIEVGDIILEINNTPSEDPFQIRRFIASLKPGTHISLVGIRGLQSYQTNITLEKQPAMQRINY